jgi:hypothetical protein
MPEDPTGRPRDLFPNKDATFLFNIDALNPLLSQLGFSFTRYGSKLRLYLHYTGGGVPKSWLIRAGKLRALLDEEDYEALQGDYDSLFNTHSFYGYEWPKQKPAQELLPWEGQNPIYGSPHDFYEELKLPINKRSSRFREYQKRSRGIYPPNLVDEIKKAMTNNRVSDFEDFINGRNIPMDDFRGAGPTIQEPEGRHLGTTQPKLQGLDPNRPLGEVFSDHDVDFQSPASSYGDAQEDMNINETEEQQNKRIEDRLRDLKFPHIPAQSYTESIPDLPEPAYEKMSSLIKELEERIELLSATVAKYAQTQIRAVEQFEKMETSIGEQVNAIETDRQAETTMGHQILERIQDLKGITIEHEKLLRRVVQPPSTERPIIRIVKPPQFSTSDHAVGTDTTNKSSSQTQTENEGIIVDQKVHSTLRVVQEVKKSTKDALDKTMAVVANIELRLIKKLGTLEETLNISKTQGETSRDLIQAEVDLMKQRLTMNETLQNRVSQAEERTEQVLVQYIALQKLYTQGREEAQQKIFELHDINLSQKTPLELEKMEQNIVQAIKAHQPRSTPQVSFPIQDIIDSVKTTMETTLSRHLPPPPPPSEQEIVEGIHQQIDNAPDIDTNEIFSDLNAANHILEVSQQAYGEAVENAIETVVKAEEDVEMKKQTLKARRAQDYPRPTRGEVGLPRQSRSSRKPGVSRSPSRERSASKRRQPSRDRSRNKKSNVEQRTIRDEPSSYEDSTDEIQQM